MSEIRRASAVCKVNVGALIADSEAIPFEGFSGGLIIVPSTEATPTLEFYSSPTEGGTFRRIYAHDSATPAQAVTAANEAKEIPPAVFGAAWLKIVASALSGGTSIEYELHLKA